MLSEEKIKEVCEGYAKFLNGKRDGIIYKADGGEVVVGNQQQKVKLNGFAYTFSKFKFAQYPHVEVKLLSDLRDTITVCFMNAEDCGEPINEYSKDEALSGSAIFDLKDFEKFEKDFKIGDVDVEVYREEKKKLEEQLEGFNNFIKEVGIEL